MDQAPTVDSAPALLVNCTEYIGWPEANITALFNGTNPCAEVVEGLQFYHYFWMVAGICALVATVISGYIIFKHLLHFNEPAVQLYIVRIIVMIPIYAIDSFLSLILPQIGFFLNVGRDCYEAYVLFTFFKLLIEFADGEQNLVTELEKVPQMKYSMPLCCFHIKPGRIFLHRCKQMILQFVWAKVILTVITFITEILHVYGEGDFSPKYAYLYVTIAYNISISISLYFLVLFYEGTKDILAEFKPIAKFLCVKAIIFFSFWQSVAIAVMTHIGVIRPVGHFNEAELAVLINNTLICIEMIPIAIAFGYTFGYKSFKLPPEERERLKSVSPIHTRIIGNFLQAANVTDIIADTVHSVQKEPERNILAGGFFNLSRLDQLQQVLEQGWLSKKGEDLAKLWKKRFVILIRSPLGIVYFKDNPYDMANAHKEVKARGFIDFMEVSGVESKRAMGFNLNTPGRAWRFNASTVKEREHWIVSIQKALASIPKAEPAPTAADDLQTVELENADETSIPLDEIGESPAAPHRVSTDQTRSFSTPMKAPASNPSTSTPEQDGSGLMRLGDDEDDDVSLDTLV